MRGVRTAAAVVLACTVVACAAAGKSGEAPPAAMPSGGAPMNDTQQKGVAPSGTGAEAPPREIGVARADVDRTARDVEASLSDCATACRALASFARATEHLCALSEPAECDDAKARLERARGRVLSSCGACK